MLVLGAIPYEYSDNSGVRHDIRDIYYVKHYSVNLLIMFPYSVSCVAREPVKYNYSTRVDYAYILLSPYVLSYYLQRTSIDSNVFLDFITKIVDSRVRRVNPVDFLGVSQTSETHMHDKPIYKARPSIALRHAETYKRNTMQIITGYRYSVITKNEDYELHQRTIYKYVSKTCGFKIVEKIYGKCRDDLTHRVLSLMNKFYESTITSLSFLISSDNYSSDERFSSIDGGIIRSYMGFAKHNTISIVNYNYYIVNIYREPERSIQCFSTEQNEVAWYVLKIIFNKILFELNQFVVTDTYEISLIDKFTILNKMLTRVNVLLYEHHADILYSYTFRSNEGIKVVSKKGLCIKLKIYYQDPEYFAYCYVFVSPIRYQELYYKLLGRNKEVLEYSNITHTLVKFLKIIISDSSTNVICNVFRYGWYDIQQILVL